MDATTTCRSVSASSVGQHAEHLLSQWEKLAERLPSMGAVTTEAVLGGHAFEEAYRWADRVADVAYLAGLSGSDKVSLTVDDARALRMVEESLARGRSILDAAAQR